MAAARRLMDGSCRSGLGRKLGTQRGCKLTSHGRRIAVIGLGYVGLPVAVAFARSGAEIIGLDIDQQRIAELRKGYDRTGEVEAKELSVACLRFEYDPAALAH